MSTITLDPLQVHSDDLGGTMGHFHGTPIVALDFRDVRRREDADMHLRIAQSRLYAQEHPDE